MKSITLENDGAQKKNLPPRLESFSGTQLSLFQSFLCNTEEERDKLSNIIGFWDSVPKYCVSRQEMTSLRRKRDGLLPNIERKFQHSGKSFVVKIRPGRLKSEDGIEKEYYPSAREELVEDALRKIAADQSCGFYDSITNNERSGVVFSLYLLRKELSKRGHTLSYYQAKEALYVLSDASIEIIAEDGKIIFKSAILPTLAAASKTDLMADPKARWYAVFHPLVTESIRELKYRQYDYDKMMRHSSQLARWLHKRLTQNYINACHSTPYNFSFLSIQRDSGLLDYKQKRDAVIRVGKALEELQDMSVICTIKKEYKRGFRAQLKDVIYTVSAHSEFIYQMKASNRRLSDARDRTSKRSNVN